MNANNKDNAYLMELHISAESFAPIPLAMRMRNRIAPVHVAQDVEEIFLTPIPCEIGAGVRVNGVAANPGALSQAIALRTGRNIIAIDVTAANGRTTIPYRLTVFRNHPAPAWRKMCETCAWLPRDSMGELIFNGNIWLFGGYTPDVARDVWRSVNGVRWEKTAEIVGSRRGFDIPLAFVFKNRMWVSDMDGVFFTSADGTNWEMQPGNAPWQGRGSAGAVVFAGRIWVMGGKDGKGFYNDVWSSEDGLNWKLEIEHAPWSPRLMHNALLMLDNKLWLIGGGVMGDYHPFRAFRDVWCSADGRTWEQVVEEAPWPGRIWSSTTVYRDRLWLLGGFRAEPAWENFGDVWYSSNGKDWRCLDCSPLCCHSGTGRGPVVAQGAMWAPRHESAVYDFGGKLWLAGGMVWPLLNDVWCLEIPGLVFLTQPVLETLAGTRYVYDASADFNKSRGNVKYRLVEGPAWLAMEPDTGRLAGTAPMPGEAKVVIEAFDDAGENAQQAFALRVLPVNYSPCG